MSETPPEPIEEPQPRAAETGPRPWNSDDGLALFGVTAIAALTRFFRLTEPKEFVFDEVYYANEACLYMRGAAKLCDFPEKNPPAEVHPPLGKWLILLGEKAFGFEAFGWRIVPAIFGVIGVALLYLLARKLLASTLAATVAAGLLAFDPLHFVESRLALLDIFPATFGLAAFLFLLHDRDRMIRRARDALAKAGLLARPWRLAAGIAGGLATASKWNGGLVFATVIVLTIVWEIASRRERGPLRAVTGFLREEGLSIVLYFGVIPFAVYVATYVGRLQGSVLDPLAEHSWVREWLRYQTNALEFHRSAVPHHGYESPPLTWILLKRPMMYWTETSAAGKGSVYALGNPLIWWPAILAFVYVLVRWVRNRDWTRAEGFMLMGFFLTYLIWPVLAPERPSVFLFYMLPAVPFLCLAVSYAVCIATKGTLRKVAIGIAGVFAVGWFFAYYPIMTNVPISQERWDAQMFFRDCDKPERRDLQTNTVTQAIDRNTTIVKTRTVTETGTKNLPPVGWCWV